MIFDGVERGSASWVKWSMAAIVAATLLAYAPAFRAPFLFDDPTSIPDNGTIRHLWPPSIPLHPPTRAAISGRPIVNYTLALNYAANELLGIDQRPDPNGPYKTVGYHVLNLLMHLACGALLFLGVRDTVRRQRYGARWAGAADEVAIIATGLWLLAPIQTEAVNYLIQRTELLVSLCYLGTLYASIRAWDAATASTRRVWYAVAIVVCLLGMGSKEVMISAPLAVVFYDRAFRFASWRELFASRRRWFYLLLIATSGWLMALIATGDRGKEIAHILGRSVGAGPTVAPGFESHVRWYQYLYNQAWAIPHYMRLALWPDALSIDYGRAGSAPGSIVGLVGLGATAVLTVLAWRRADRWGWFAFLATWFFMILTPTSSIVPLATEVAAERRFYLALAPMIIVLMIGADALWRRWGARTAGTLATQSWGRRVLPVALIALGVAATGATFQRSVMYQDPESMWRNATLHVPWNARAYENLGVVTADEGPGRAADAADAFRRAVAIDSSYPPSLIHLATLDISLGRPATADSLLERVLRIDPNDLAALRDLGDLLVHSGMPDRAIPYLRQANAEQSTDTTLLDLGIAYMGAGRRAEAVATFQATLSMNPYQLEAMDYVAAVLTDDGHSQEAMVYLDRAVRLSPDSALSYALRSRAEVKLDRADDAGRDAAAAAAKGGNNAIVFRIAGQAMLAAKRLGDAEAYLGRAVQLAPDDHGLLTALADTKMSLGKRDEATELYRRASGGSK